MRSFHVLAAGGTAASRKPGIRGGRGPRSPLTQRHWAQGAAQQLLVITGEKGRLAALGSFFSTVSGLLTGIAAMITAIAVAFFGGTQVPSVSAQPAPTVTVTHTVTALPAAATTPGDDNQTGATASGQPSPATSATGMDLASTTIVSSSVDQLKTGDPQQIGAKKYSDAIRFSCSASGSDTIDYGFHSLIFEVAGYNTFDATFGVPDDAGNDASNTAAAHVGADHHGESDRGNPALNKSRKLRGDRLVEVRHDRDRPRRHS